MTLLTLKSRLYEIIFEAETREGRLFDVALLWIILLSIAIVILESVGELRSEFHGIFVVIEWIITVVFTIEYALRLWVVKQPVKYATSPLGIIDLAALLPSYLSLLLIGSQYFIVIRALRLLRIFRILKLHHYLGGARVITQALKASRYKIIRASAFKILVWGESCQWHDLESHAFYEGYFIFKEPRAIKWP